MLQKYHAELIPIINYFSLIQSDLCISDEQGRIAFVSDGYCIRHGVEKEKLIGASPSAIEKQNLFYPSITKEKKEDYNCTNKSKRRCCFINSYTCA